MWFLDTFCFDLKEISSYFMKVCQIVWNMMKFFFFYWFSMTVRDLGIVDMDMDMEGRGLNVHSCGRNNNNILPQLTMRRTRNACTSSHMTDVTVSGKRNNANWQGGGYGAEALRIRLDRPTVYMSMFFLLSLRNWSHYKTSKFSTVFIIIFLLWLLSHRIFCTIIVTSITSTTEAEAWLVRSFQSYISIIFFCHCQSLAEFRFLFFLLNVYRTCIYPVE